MRIPEEYLNEFDKVTEDFEWGEAFIKVRKNPDTIQFEILRNATYPPIKIKDKNRRDK